MNLFFSGNIPALPSGLSVAVYDHDGTDNPSTLATITDRSGTTITQPGFVTDSNGRFEFGVDGADGLYDIKLGGGAGSPDTSWNGGSALWIRGQALGTPGAEPALGNPDVDGKVLASTTAGVRSWVALPEVAADQLATAWVNFVGTGTVSINASYNVSSITDNGTGDYTANISLADANYAATTDVLTAGSAATSYQYLTKSTSQLRMRSVAISTGTLTDCDSVSLKIHGGN